MLRKSSRNRRDLGFRRKKELTKQDETVGKAIAFITSYILHGGICRLHCAVFIPYRQQRRNRVRYITGHSTLLVDILLVDLLFIGRMFFRVPCSVSDRKAEVFGSP